MSRYFFDIDDGGRPRDDTGSECADLDEARCKAIRLLPDIVREALPKDGDRRTFTVLVTGEDDRTAYVATLIFTGLSLTRW